MPSGNVKRSDLFRTSRSRSPSSFPTDSVSSSPSLSSKNALPYPPPPLLDFQIEEKAVTSENENDPSNPSTREDKGGEGTFEFRLFRSGPTFAQSKNQRPSSQQLHDDEQNRSVARINIRSPTPVSQSGDGGGGGFVNPHRLRRYYFTFDSANDANDANGNDNANDDLYARKRVQQQQEYLSAAISGPSVLQAHRIPWPGTHLPFRVIHIPPQPPASSFSSSSSSHPTKSSTSSLTSTSTISTTPAAHSSNPSLSSERKEKKPRSRSRSRAGKKRRIATRKKFAEERAAEERGREKRARRNREKKVKKRERERDRRRRKKLEGAGGEEGEERLVGTEEEAEEEKDRKEGEGGGG